MKFHTTLFRTAAFLLTFCLSYTISAQETTYDILILNGKIMDGSGAPWYYGDIAINGDKVVAMGKLKGKALGKETIDATGLVIAPGFIDLHSHAFDRFRPDVDRIPNEADFRIAPNMVAQGVTTVVTNHDGRGPLEIGEQLELLRKNGGTGPNVITLIGHGTIRGAAMGSDFRREANAEEITRMKELVKKAMEEGAWGMSAALEYPPAIWSTTEELVQVVGSLKEYEGAFIQHERAGGMTPMWYLPSMRQNRPASMIQSVVETIEVAERTGVKSVASHIKVRGADFWGASSTLVRLISDARARGVEIYADHYPYITSGSDGFTTLIPPSIRNRGKEALRKALDDPEQSTRIRRDIGHELNRRGGPKNIVVMDYPDKELVGKSLLELQEKWNISAIDLAIKLALEGSDDFPGGVRLRGFSMSEIDLEVFAQQPWMVTATDGAIALPSMNPVNLHARFYGTFPRKIRKYALENKNLTVEQAILSMTYLPAQILGLTDRGYLKEGNFADLVLFDLETVRDKSTFFDVHQYPDGIPHVLVNGEFVVKNGEILGATPGRTLEKTN